MPQMLLTGKNSEGTCNHSEQKIYRLNSHLYIKKPKKQKNQKSNQPTKQNHL